MSAAARPARYDGAMSTIQGLRARWRMREPRDEAAAESLAGALRVHPVFARLLVERGVSDRDGADRFFEPRLTALHDPAKLPGCAAAAERIATALRQGEQIVIYGDYDVDGVCATAILYHMLKAAAPEADVRRYIPHRIDEGYGINREALGKIIDGGAKLIVSVDCGITACEPAELARRRCVDLIITDHHECAGDLPEAFALVHPRIGGDDAEPYPFGELCGAGVAYKLAWQVARTLCGSERVSDVLKRQLLDLLSLAALATVADVVPLVDENRAIVRFGLGQIKRTPYAGLNALIDASRLRDEKVDAYHAGFVLGPKLNACGRMGHAIEACKLLTTATGDEARRIAAFLENENQRRRTTEREIFEQAAEQVTARGYDRDEVRAIVLADPQWHPGVIGIVCSRLVERFCRPVVLLNTANGIAQGSARSIEGYALHEALAACAEHLTTHGGHAMAAGMKLATDKVDAFREALVAHAGEHISVEQLAPTLTLDGELPLDELTQNLCEQVERIAPFGRGNAEPLLLLRDVAIAQNPQTVGRNGDHLVVTVKQAGRHLRCIAWRRGELVGELRTGQTLHLAIRPKLNRWNNRVNVEAVIEDLAPA